MASSTLSGWYGTAYECAANPSLSHGVGWYSNGQLMSSTYNNPATGQPYTPQEQAAWTGGGTTATPGTTNSQEYTSLAGVENPTQEQLDAAGFGLKPPPTVAPPVGHPAWTDPNLTGMLTGLSPGDPISTAPGATTPTFGEGAAAGVPTPEVTPAPAYEVSPEMQEMMDLYGDTLTDWVTSGGYGLDPETQSLMIQQQTDTLKAREQENIRVMKNNMERRGITNSGYVQAAQNQITSNTSVAIAGAIADVQIKSALMKMASFEKGMGAMAQYLGFLSEQSQLAYAPEFATWQAEQMATMQAWQGKMDIYKMELNQAYQTQNMQLQAQLTSQLNTEQHNYNIELAEMEIEANQQIATAQGIGGIFGTILGFIFGK